MCTEESRVVVVGRKNGMGVRTKLVCRLELMLFIISSLFLLLFFPPSPLLTASHSHSYDTDCWVEIKYLLIMLGEEEIDVSSECSSGCQSGWTAYLDHSSCGSSLPLEYKKGHDSLEEEEEEEEDLSMVSDASSGPPHLPEQDELSLRCINSRTCFEGNGSAKCGSAKKRRVEPEQQYQKHYSSLLDDTASSPLLSQSKAIFAGEDSSSSYMKTVEGDLEFSGGFSATHFKRNNTAEKKMGFLQSTSLAKPRPARPVKRFP